MIVRTLDLPNHINKAYMFHGSICYPFNVSYFLSDCNKKMPLSFLLFLFLLHESTWCTILSKLLHPFYISQIPSFFFLLYHQKESKRTNRAIVVGTSSGPAAAAATITLLFSPPEVFAVMVLRFSHTIMVPSSSTQKLLIIGVKTSSSKEFSLFSLRGKKESFSIGKRRAVTPLWGSRREE